MIELPPDPYEALGVKQDAPLSDIRTAFRKLVLKAHPDKVQDPDLKQQKTEEFHAIHQAWEILSDDTKRKKYHQNKELYELKMKEAARASMATSSPGNPRSHRSTSYYEEPRTSYSSSAHKVYHRTPPHSWEEMRGGYDQPPKSSATAEREARAARRESEKAERKWQEQQELAKEARRAERREERKKEKKKEEDREKRKDKESREKEKKKERKRQQQQEEIRQRQAEQAEYVTSSSSESEEDDPMPHRSERKKSTNSRMAETSPQPPPTSERERKHSINLDQAREYLTRSGAHVPTLSRAATMDSAGVPFAYAPTPPPAGNPFQPPPGPAGEEDSPKRSSKSSRRPPSTREKTMHKKSSARDRSREPIIVDATPSRKPPSLSKSHTETPFTRAMPGLQRSHTEQPSYTRTPGGWAAEDSSEHERSRSRGDGAPVFSSDEDDVDTSARRSRRRRHTPEDIIESSTQRYTVKKGQTAAVPIPTVYGPDGASPRSHRSSKNSYPIPNTSATRMPPGSFESYEGGYHTPNVKYAPTFEQSDIQFTNLPYRTQYAA